MTKIFTPEVVAQIPIWVSQNQRADEIAARIGCSISTLKVRCSQLKISLRRPNWKEYRKRTLSGETPKLVPNAGMPGPLPIARRRQFKMQSTLALSRVAQARLAQRAEACGLTEAELAASLLEVIALDDLYDAVLDVGRAA